MTEVEFGQLAAAIKTYFPRDNMLPTKDSMTLWFEALKDLEYSVANTALRIYINTNKFPPTIADIRECSASITKPQADELNEMAAWGLVQKALRRCTYYADEEFEKLPYIVQKAIVSPAQLKEWAIMEDMDGRALNVMQSNFMRTFRAEQERQKEISKLSPDLVKLLHIPKEKEVISKKENKVLSISEERELFLKDSVPAPDGLSEKVKSILYKNENNNNGETTMGTTT